MLAYYYLMSTIQLIMRQTLTKYKQIYGKSFFSTKKFNYILICAEKYFLKFIEALHFTSVGFAKALV